MLKIVKETPTSIVIKDSRLAGVLSVGIILILVGLSGIIKLIIMPMLLWIILIFLGVIFILAIHVTTINIDKGKNLLSISRLTITGRRTIDNPLDKIKSINILTEQSSYKGRPRTTQSLICTLKDDAETPLIEDHYHSQKTIFSLKSGVDLKDLGQNIASFLNVAFKETNLSLSDALSMVAKTVEKSIEKAKKEKKV